MEVGVARFSRFRFNVVRTDIVARKSAPYYGLLTLSKSHNRIHHEPSTLSTQKCKTPSYGQSNIHT